MPSRTGFPRRAALILLLACLTCLQLPPGRAAPLNQPYPRSFEVYATQYDAGERKIVALPDKCLKFANGGAQKCPGYEYGQDYSVAISYKGEMVVALVGEAGPWNIDDNYWAKPSDPQPRRMFTDLPLGVPAAQAAYFDGYNGGLDQFGRPVASPVGIDISTALAADLGLPAGNVKVTVSFLWTAGWDDAQAAPPPGAPTPAQSILPATGSVAWETAVPQADGSVKHIVQSGQTLVGIATVYGVPLAELLALNGLDMQSVIQPGERILVRLAQPSAQPTASPNATVSAATPTSRLPASATPGRQATLQAPEAQQPAQTDAPAASSRLSPRLAVLGAIVLVAAAGVVLLVWGWAARRERG
jgi:LysM repeat protein